MEHGADKDQADCEGLTPLHYAAAGGDDDDDDDDVDDDDVP